MTARTTVPPRSLAATEQLVRRGWNPLEPERPPETDDRVFELLTAAVFEARFNADVVRTRWPSIRAAFAEFRLREVAGWPDAAVDALIERPGIIRSPKKIRATLRNARDLTERVRRYGSARAYLDSFGADRERLVRDIDTWAHYIGAPSIRWFAGALGPQPR